MQHGKIIIQEAQTVIQYAGKIHYFTYFTSFLVTVIYCVSTP